jgi:hypothetical protein
MPPLSRRALLGTLATATAIGVAGCATDKHFPDADAGPKHVELRHCSRDADVLDVSLTVTALPSGTTVHDATYSISDDYCSDMGSAYYVHEVFEERGRYRIEADVADEPASLDRVVRIDPATIDDFAPVKLVSGPDDIELDLRDGARTTQPATTEPPTTRTATTERSTDRPTTTRGEPSPSRSNTTTSTSADGPTTTAPATSNVTDGAEATD